MRPCFQALPHVLLGHTSKLLERLPLTPNFCRKPWRSLTFCRTLQILRSSAVPVGSRSRIVNQSKVVWPHVMASFSARSRRRPKNGMPWRAKCNMGWWIQPLCKCQPNLMMGWGDRKKNSSEKTPGRIRDTKHPKVELDNYTPVIHNPGHRKSAACK